MGTAVEAFQNHTRHPVPSARRVKVWPVVVGVALAVPAYLTGGQVSLTCGHSSWMSAA
jgi:hypothetical protein